MERSVSNFDTKQYDDLVSCHQFHTNSSEYGLIISHYSYPEDMFQSTFRSEPRAPSIIEQNKTSSLKNAEISEQSVGDDQKQKGVNKKVVYKNLRNIHRHSLVDKDHERIKSMKIQKKENFPDCVHSKNVKSHH